MALKSYAAPVANSTDVFQPNIFKGKVLFCTGGGSGICRAMTEAIVGVLLLSGFQGFMLRWDCY